jgi:hypothetical protein
VQIVQAWVVRSPEEESKPEIECGRGCGRKVNIQNILDDCGVSELTAGRTSRLGWIRVRSDLSDFDEENEEIVYVLGRKSVEWKF